MDLVVNENEKEFGTLNRWVEDRGFGFLRRDDGGKDVFVHIRDLEAAGIPEPKLGDRFRYEVGTGLDGRRKAVAIEAVQ